MVYVSADRPIDYEETAKQATLAFGFRDKAFSPERVRWLYEQSFSAGCTVVGLYDGDEKVGQIAMVRQHLTIQGQPEAAAQIVDLWVLKKYRSRKVLAMLYDEIERQFRQQSIRLALGFPNANAVSVNEHFFQLKKSLVLPIRIGTALPLLSERVRVSAWFDEANAAELIPLFDTYKTDATLNSVQWDGRTLFERLRRPDHRYGVHATDDLLLVSSLRRYRGVSYVLLAGFFARSGRQPLPSDVRDLARAACRLWGLPLFIYAGVNTALPQTPGFPMPDRARPSLMLMQLRDFQPEKPPVTFDRFELIDFDFA